MKRVFNFLTVMAFMVALLSSCGSGIDVSNLGKAVENQEYKIITPEKAEEIIGAKNVYLIDVRNADEFITGYIPGALNVRLNDLGTQIGDVVRSTNSIIIVYCASGVRSGKAARILCNKGYKNVFDLGGIDIWPYEVVSEKN